MRTGLWRRVFAALLAGLLFPCAASARSKQWKREWEREWQGERSRQTQERCRAARLSEVPLSTRGPEYGNYVLLQTRKYGLPPGLAKRNGDLPPGLEKQLQRNGQLPPGLRKSWPPCPVEMTRQLPPIPPDYQRSVIGANIIIFDKRSKPLFVDVMQDVRSLGQRKPKFRRSDSSP